MKFGHFTDAERARAMALLDRVGGGGRQEAGATFRWHAAARRDRAALRAAAPLVLADEPTGNLDTQSSDAVFALMRDFNREDGVAFLIVTHDPRLAAR